MCSILFLCTCTKEDSKEKDFYGELTPSKFVDLTENAILLMAQDSVREARGMLRVLEKIAPNNEQVQFYKGISYYLTQDTAKANATFKNAIRIIDTKIQTSSRYILLDKAICIQFIYGYPVYRQFIDSLTNTQEYKNDIWFDSIWYTDLHVNNIVQSLLEQRKEGIRTILIPN